MLCGFWETDDFRRRRIEWTVACFKAGSMEIDFGSFEACVSHLLLNHANIYAVAKQAGGERMAEGVRIDSLGDIEGSGGFAEG